ncbi:hypothetical protein KEJ17_02420 [Candidatus Bathyarchaeota archaeon]|nr:hypothetical protein [Candidatus Bathyarchaeota archaeon]
MMFSPGSGISNIREKLIVMNVPDQVRIGDLTLEAGGFVVNSKTGRLRRLAG